MALLTDKKLFANGFLSDMIPLCFMPAGNCSRIVSCPTWLHCVSHRQETFRQEISRLRFAPLEMTGAAGRHGASYRRETVREWFPTRHDAFVFHAGRKLFAHSFLSDLTPGCFLPTGNCLPGDFSTPLRSARNDRSGGAPWRFLPTRNYSRMVSYST